MTMRAQSVRPLPATVDPERVGVIGERLEALIELEKLRLYVEKQGDTGVDMGKIVNFMARMFK